MDQLMEKFRQMTETNKIIGDQIEQPTKNKRDPGKARTIREKLSNKNESYLAKLDLSGYFWTHGWRVTKVHRIRSCKTKKDGNQDRATWKTLWGYQISTSIGCQRDG